MSNGAAAANGSSTQTHTPSQRYLSTRGEDTGVCHSPTFPFPPSLSSLP